MLSIGDIRNTLPDGGKDLTDEQVAELRDSMYELAQLCFDVWLKEKQSGKLTT
jgi:hypothetical protein